MSNSTMQKINFNITIPESVILRGRPIKLSETSLVMDVEAVNCLSYKKFVKVVYQHYLNIYKKENDSANRDILHYLHSKKLLPVFYITLNGKSSPVYKDEHLYDVKISTAFSNSFDVVIYFFKISTMNTLSEVGVKEHVSKFVSFWSKKSEALDEKAEGENDDQGQIQGEEECQPEKLVSSTSFDSETSNDSPKDSNDYGSESITEQLIDLIKPYIDAAKISTTSSELKHNLGSVIDNKLKFLLGVINGLQEQLLEKKIENKSATPPLASKKTSIRGESVHKNIYCDLCDKSVEGIRFKCLECYDFDLCEICEISDPTIQNHLPTHHMVKIPNPMPSNDRYYSIDIKNKDLKEIKQEEIIHCNVSLKDEISELKKTLEKNTIELEKVSPLIKKISARESLTVLKNDFKEEEKSYDNLVSKDKAHVAQFELLYAYSENGRNLHIGLSHAPELRAAALSIEFDDGFKIENHSIDFFNKEKHFMLDMFDYSTEKVLSVGEITQFTINADGQRWKLNARSNHIKGILNLVGEFEQMLINSPNISQTEDLSDVDMLNATSVNEKKDNKVANFYCLPIIEDEEKGYNILINGSAQNFECYSPCDATLYLIFNDLYTVFPFELVNNNASFISNNYGKLTNVYLEIGDENFELKFQNEFSGEFFKCEGLNLTGKKLISLLGKSFKLNVGQINKPNNELESASSYSIPMTSIQSSMSMDLKRDELVESDEDEVFEDMSEYEILSSGNDEV